MKRFIKSTLFSFFIILLLLFALARFYGYDPGTIKFINKPAKFCLDKFEFSIDKNYKLVQFYDSKSKIIYQNGYIPFFNQEIDSGSYALLANSEKRNLIDIRLDSGNLNSRMKEGCLSREDCNYIDMNLFGHSARVAQFQEFEIIEIQDLDISIHSTPIKTNFWRYIYLSQCTI